MNRRTFLACAAGAAAAGCDLSLREIRGHNALRFDFVLKRSLASGSARFARGAFETRPFFFAPS